MTDLMRTDTPEQERLVRVEVELQRLSKQGDLQTKLIFTLASVTRRQLKSGCAEQRAITEQMQDLRGGVKEHLRAEAALQRELRAMRGDT